MILVPVAFFAAAEGGLRLAGFGESYPLFIPVEGKPEFLFQNRDVARRYFTRIENVPTSLADFFDAEKDSSTFRIFVQGGSSAAGFPFYYGGSFSRMLEQRLIQTFPERHIEVINTAMAAVNSYTLLDFVDEIIDQEPDAVLIYAGHNEYYGALGVGSTESFGNQPWLVRTYLALSDLRLMQALQRGIGWMVGQFAGSETGDSSAGTLMAQMVSEQEIAYGSRDYFRGLRQFRSNLARILAQYSKHGIPVFIGTLASNESDHAPFISSFEPETDEAAWTTLYEKGVAAADSGEWQAALGAFNQAIAMDSIQANAYYARGRVLERIHRYDDARRDYLAAKDRDELRFRAPEAMNEIIRTEAARHGAVLVESQHALAVHSSNRIIGSDVMLEHLHPNVDGYFVLADAFYDALRTASMIGEWSAPVEESAARREVLLTEVDSLVGIFRIRQLESTWPFQPAGVTRPWIDSIQPGDVPAQIALDLFQEKVSWREANLALYRAYENRGDHHGALKAALAHVQELPFLPQPYLAAGNQLLKLGRFDAALAYFEEANRQEETATAHRMIGSILLQRGDRSGAIPHLETALALDPRNTPALYNLSGAYALAGHVDEARRTVKRLLAIEPDHVDGRRLLASLSSD